MGSYLALNNTGYVSTPDSAGLSIAGDLELICRARLPDWTPGTDEAVLSKKDSSSTFGQEWYFYINAAGTPIFRWTDGGDHTVTSASATGFTDGTWGWLRVTLDVDDGAGNHVVTFYTSTTDTEDPGSVSWTQLDQQTVAGTTSIRDQDSPVMFGATVTPASPSTIWAGDVQYAAIYATPFGTPDLRGEIDLRALLSTDTSYTDSIGNVWTFGGTYTIQDATDPSVVWSIVGVPADTTAVVTAKLVNAATGGVLKVSTSSDLSTPVYTSSNVAPDVAGCVRFTATGLTANTAYHYGIEVDGTASDAAKRGRFTTLPTPGAQHSFTFAHTNCMNTPHDVLTHIDGVADPDLLFFLGDFDYSDNDGSSADAIRVSYDGQLADSRLQAAARNRLWVSTYDDHDFLGDNVSGDTNATTQANRQVRSAEFQRYFPLPATLPDSTTNGAIYHSFVVGRVRFIVLDERYYSSPYTATDDASKTVLGSTQKTWFKNQLVEAEPVKIVVHSRTWSGAPLADADTWSRYTTERTEICDYIEANAAQVGGVVFVQGDAHANLADDGQSTDYTTAGTFGGQMLVCGSATNQTGSIKGGPYRIARLGTTAQEDSGGAHYGFMTVTDNGSTIDVAWEGRESTTGAEDPATVTVPTDGAALTASFTVGQFAHPDADLFVGSGWTDEGGATTNLFESIDEATASDADYVRSPDSPSSSVYVCSLSTLTDPGVHTGHTLHYRYDKENVSGTPTVDLTVELRQGYVNETTQGILIASATHNGIADGFTNGSLELSTGEVSNITDYTDLSVRFSTTQAA